MNLIDGVKVAKLVLHQDERGSLTELYTENQKDFWSGPPRHVYTSEVYADCVKAFHYHKIQTDRFSCVYGLLKLVLFDCRPDSKTVGEINEFFLGPSCPKIVEIPPGVLHGFKGCPGEGEKAIVINSCSHPYNPADPDEYRVHPHYDGIQKEDFKTLDLPFDVVPYDWKRKDF